MGVPLVAAFAGHLGFAMIPLSIPFGDQHARRGSPVSESLGLGYICLPQGPLDNFLTRLTLEETSHVIKTTSPCSSPTTRDPNARKPQVSENTQQSGTTTDDMMFAGSTAGANGPNVKNETQLNIKAKQKNANNSHDKHANRDGYDKDRGIQRSMR